MIRAYHPVHLVLGLAIWSVWFITIYGGLSVGCAIAPPTVESGALNWLNGFLLLTTAATLSLLAYLIWHCWRLRRRPETLRKQRFIALVSAGLYAVSMIATFVIGLPALALPPCV